MGDRAGDCDSNATKTFDGCDNCKANFSCSRLNMALKVAEGRLKTLPFDDPRRLDLKRRLDSVRAELEGWGWRFPDGTRACHVANADSAIWRKTDELIAALRQADGEKPLSFEKSSLWLEQLQD